MNKHCLGLAGCGVILLGILLLACAIERFLSPNSYEAVVRLEKVPYMGCIEPYWLRYQFETLQSTITLYRVITNLNLSHRWAEKLNKAEPLRLEVACAQLKKQIDVGQPRGTSFIDVKVRSSDPIEASEIASEIAAVYLAYQEEQRKEMSQQGIRIWKAELEKRDREITNKLVEVKALKASSGTKGSEARVLESLQYIREKVISRIHQEEEESAARSNSLVHIVDRAQPPLFPRPLQKALPIAAIFGGLAAIPIGTSLLRKRKSLRTCS